MPVTQRDPRPRDLRLQSVTAEPGTVLRKPDANPQARHAQTLTERQWDQPSDQGSLGSRQCTAAVRWMRTRESRVVEAAGSSPGRLNYDRLLGAAPDQRFAASLRPFRLLSAWRWNSLVVATNISAAPSQRQGTPSNRL